MAMFLDKKIGSYYYDWTKEETERNSYYDPWVELWRPRPETSRGLPTPAFSGNIAEALGLVKYISDHYCIATSIYRDVFGTWSVVMRKLGNPVMVQQSGTDLPESIAKCAIKLQESEFTDADLQLIKASWGIEEEVLQEG